jgi:hypothetical protein
METQIEKVFVKMNQVWLKGEAIPATENSYKVRVPNYPDFTIEKDSEFLEHQKFPAQRFAIGDAKERLEGAYISFSKLPDNIQDAIIKGEEYLHTSSYIANGSLKHQVKMVQMVYQQNTGSKLDVQIKRNEPVPPGEAKAYNYQFTREEFDQMKDQGKIISFIGTSTNGEKFTKLAYYEPRLNDIRTKSALSENTYFYGKPLTKDQADALNNGRETEITIPTKRGEKTYLVSWSPKAERFITKSVEQSKLNNMKVTAETVQPDVKKKSTKGQTVRL